MHCLSASSLYHAVESMARQRVNRTATLTLPPVYERRAVEAVYSIKHGIEHALNLGYTATQGGHGGRRCSVIILGHPGSR